RSPNLSWHSDAALAALCGGHWAGSASVERQSCDLLWLLAFVGASGTFPAATHFLFAEDDFELCPLALQSLRGHIAAVSQKPLHCPFRLAPRVHCPRSHACACCRLSPAIRSCQREIRP